MFSILILPMTKIGSGNFVSGLSMNGVQSHSHIPTHTSLYLGVLSLHMHNFLWRVNGKPTL